MKIIECPRDAMQGIHDWIPTEIKIEYLNRLLAVGFDTLDFGSFVSHKAVPQMRDTPEVLSFLNPSSTKLLAIVANERGTQEACQFDQIHYLGYPFSVSDTFQRRNTGKSIEESKLQLLRILELAIKHDKELIVYLSMAFGNPYQEPYDIQKVLELANEVKECGVKIISVADTTGVASAQMLLESIPMFKNTLVDIEFGVHLHSTRTSSFEKIKIIYSLGIQRMDGALGGFGGCPFATDTLTGNIDTLEILKVSDYPEINKYALENALAYSNFIFSKFH